MHKIPLFTSAYSFRSILTLDKPKEVKDGGPDSIIKICEDEKIKDLFLIEEDMVGFLEAKKNCGKDINLHFGLRISICGDINDKETSSRKTESKYIIFATNDNGYYGLVKISSFANTQGFNKYPRIDFKNLKKLWGDGLLLAIPFYDSFIHRNWCYISSCVPDFSFCKPVFFVEDNGLFIDDIIKQGIESFCKDSDYEKINTKTIYYKDKEDFKAWQTYKCIKDESRKATLHMPGLEQCASDLFCVEAWKNGE